MTPLIIPDIHEKLSQDVVGGRPAPVAQIIVSLLPNGMVIADFSGIPSRQVANMMMSTAHQDLVEVCRSAERGPQSRIGVVTDPQAIAKLNTGKR
jgi:hypothetical protein